MTPASLTRMAVVAATCATLGLGPTGCSFSYRFGATPTVAGKDVAAQVSGELAAKYGSAPETVTCPDLKGEVGTRITCQLTTGGKTYDVAVATTSVVDDKVRFSIDVASTPVGAPPPTTRAAPPVAVAPPSAVRSAPGDASSAYKSSAMTRADAGALPGRTLAREITKEWRERYGRTPYPPTCPDLPAVVGETVTCRLTDQGERYAVTATTTSVRGILVRYTLRGLA